MYQSVVRYIYDTTSERTATFMLFAVRTSNFTHTGSLDRYWTCFLICRSVKSAPYRIIDSGPAVWIEATLKAGLYIKPWLPRWLRFHRRYFFYRTEQCPRPQPLRMSAGSVRGVRRPTSSHPRRLWTPCPCACSGPSKCSSPCRTTTGSVCGRLSATTVASPGGSKALTASGCRSGGKERDVL